MLKRKLPPPNQFTIKDGIQILFGLLMIPLGGIILYNTFVRGAAIPAVLIGGAFIAFGVYRVTFAWGRLRWYYGQRTIKHD
jgi:uncharacterized membrane protein HdeD (DUF308 family)